MKHQKHTALVKPDLGNWHRYEWAILGGKCSDIQSIAVEIRSSLPNIKHLYIDADHGSSGDETNASDHYINRISHYEWAFSGTHNKYQTRAALAGYNLVLVNGNHYQAHRQIAICDTSKEASLKKRIDQLTDVQAVLLHENRSAPFTWLTEYLASKNQSPKILEWSDRHQLAKLIDDKNQPPPLKALILAGGKSTRMGENKANIEYHQTQQYRYLTDLLENKVEAVHISCRSDQVDLYKDLAVIEDSFIELGPFGAILSAFRYDPNSAWLVVACDLPMLSVDTFDQLIQERNPQKDGTAFKSHFSQWMEPLISIYEPSIYPIGLQLLGQGYSCARKIMINADTEIIEAQNPEWLMNANTPIEREEALKAIQG